MKILSATAQRAYMAFNACKDNVIASVCCSMLLEVDAQRDWKTSQRMLSGRPLKTLAMRTT
jgi:hypothetical protein